MKKLGKVQRWLKRRVLRRSWMADEFGNPHTQEAMLRDKIRCEAYREAIRRTVKPGDVVVDLGAGTGLLSFFAIQAGARHVYALELSKVADTAAQLIEANGFRGRITLLRKNSKKAQLPERCDVLITETLSSFCFDTENIIESVADARTRFLKPGGRIIPEAADTFLLPYSSEAFGPGSFVPRFYELDYRPFARKLLEKFGEVRAVGEPLLALSPPGLCYKIDFYKEMHNPGKSFVPFRLTADGRLDGFLGWFEARLCEGVTVSNSPFLPPTHWWQLFLPVTEQQEVRAGEILLLGIDPNIVGGEARWKYAVQTGGARPDSPS